MLLLNVCWEDWHSLPCGAPPCGFEWFRLRFARDASVSSVLVVTLCLCCLFAHWVQFILGLFRGAENFHHSDMLQLFSDSTFPPLSQIGFGHVCWHFPFRRKPRGGVWHCKLRSARLPCYSYIQWALVHTAGWMWKADKIRQIRSKANWNQWNQCNMFMGS